MPLATYTDLKASIADWLNRDDLAGAIPTFISLAEAKINRELRVGAMESAVSGNLTVSGSLALPTDCIEIRRVIVNGHSLEQLTPDQLRDKYGSTQTGQPVNYAVIGTTIHFGPLPDSTYSYDIVIYSKLAALSTSNESNWFTANAPDLLLYGSLVEASPYVQDDTRVPMWQAMFARVMADVKTQDQRMRNKSLTLSISPDLLT